MTGSLSAQADRLYLYYCRQKESICYRLLIINMLDLNPPGYWTASRRRFGFIRIYQRIIFLNTSERMPGFRLRVSIIQAGL